MAEAAPKKSGGAKKEEPTRPPYCAVCMRVGVPLVPMPCGHDKCQVS